MTQLKMAADLVKQTGVELPRRGIKPAELAAARRGKDIIKANLSVGMAMGVPFHKLEPSTLRGPVKYMNKDGSETYAAVGMGRGRERSTKRSDFGTTPLMVTGTHIRNWISAWTEGGTRGAWLGIKDTAPERARKTAGAHLNGIGSPIRDWIALGDADEGQMASAGSKYVYDFVAGRITGRPIAPALGDSNGED